MIQKGMKMRSLTKNLSGLRFLLILSVLMLGTGNVWGYSYYNYYAYYAKVTANTASESTGRGLVYVSTSAASVSNATSASSAATGQDPTTNYSSAPTSGGAVTFYLYAKANDGYKFDGWSTSATRPEVFASTSASWQTTFPAGYGTSTSESGSNSQTNNYSYDNNGNQSKYYSVTASHNVYAYFSERIMAFDVSFAQPENGFITVNGVTPSSWPYAAHTTTGSLSCTMTATPSAGYVFFGYYVLNSDNSKNYLSRTASAILTFEEPTTVYAEFVPDTWAWFQLGTETFYDLNLANAKAVAAGGGTIVQIKDGTMPTGNYTISENVKLFIPYSTATAVQTLPKVVTTAATLSAYRKLSLAEGINITVESGGAICVGGQIMSAGGGKPSAYPTGACGMIDMSAGGHIELNGGSVLYAWGFIKGQDMDQGNNTVGVGTITANNGATVWEMFAVGDWRGGTACSTIYNNRNSWKFFPFQSYTVQNIEVPTTYKYGSTLSNYTNVYGGGGTNPGQFAIIGKENTLFLLKDAQSLVRKWYDPTTDLVCYEMSGTTQLDALNVDVSITSVSSSDYNLPLSSSMHIILTNCSTTISKPMVVQAGAVVEVKSDATLTCTSNVYLFDKDQWGQYCYNKYFYSMTNLTIHKNRGTTNAGLDDAKLIVDGTFIAAGKIYSTTSGADIMGNGGGKATFNSLPGATNIVMCTGVSTNENVAVAAANLHNEDASYTKTAASTTFHNVNGRWYAASAKDEKANHTYDFTYISSGDVSGTGGTNTTTDAVYSNDKTGLEARMKWFNVSADGCADWWHGQGEQTGWFYNWTVNNAWHQFLPTATEGLYSGSNNTLYTKSDCTWEELGSTDVNCLYTIDDTKKALVNGQFVALSPNDDDPAYHEAADPTKYYICFAGCNWHAATKYEGEEKTYVVEEGIYIWYDGAWLNVERQDPYFYTLSETNVKIYYDYIDGDWQLATPCVRVVDGLEDRSYYFLSEAFTFANSALRTSPTITILRDIKDITAAVSYTGANKTCTLDLNGHTITGSVTNMITVNAAGCTFYIVDNTEQKLGKINLVFSANNSRRRALYVQNGHAILNSGTIASTNTLAYSSTNTKPYAGGVLVASGKQFTMNGGRIEVSSSINPYGIEGASSTPTINIKGGTIETVAEKKDSPYAIYGYGTINISGGTIHAIAKASTSAMGVYVVGNGSVANISGGTILARATGSAQGVRCWGSATVTGDYNAETPDNTPKSRTYSQMNITGGTITAECTTGTTAYGVLSYGITTISGGTVTATVQKSDQNTAYGVCTLGGITTIQNGANITANAPTKTYGAYCSGANGDSNRGWPHVGVLNITGGTITANTTASTIAYGLYVTGATWTINKTNDYKVFNGDYASAGTATVTGGTFYANAKTTDAGGIKVDNTVTKNAASATPICTIDGGYYKATGTGTLNGCAGTALAENFQINGGYYSHDGNLATYVTSPKHVLTLAAGDANRPPYYHKVAEAYLVTFKSEDGTANIIDPVYQEVGTKPVCSTEPTKGSTSTNSFTFDGWAIAANGAKVYEKNGLPDVTSAGATYYAHFATTTLKYRVHFDATTNGGDCATENSYVEPGTAIGSLPTATKYGYTFSGWFTEATGGTQLTATTVIDADGNYYAQFTANTHTLVWNLDGGKVSTAGKIGSTTWPAKNATGTPSRSVAYGTVLTTIPVVAKTGYTFNRWNPVPASSMPDADVTYTALWNPNTNTKYSVYHYLQNTDGTYPTEPNETEALTGTTGASVTPETKSYIGYSSPEKQTVTIAAAGNTVVAYYYPLLVYTISWNASANGGACATASSTVRHGEAFGEAMPTATKSGYRQIGWYTKAEGGNLITAETAIQQNYGTLYAHYEPTYTIIWKDETGKELRRDEMLMGESLTPPAYSKTNTAEWTYTFHGWNNGSTTYAANAIPSVSGAAIYTADVTKVKNSYTITWLNDDDSQIDQTTVEYGVVPTHADVAKAEDENYVYTFAGWTPEVTSVTGEATYKASFASKNVEVTVGSVTTPFSSIDEAFTFVNEQTANTEIKLLKDVTAAASLVYQPTSTYTCTLDLNNHTISGAVAKLIDINLAKSTFVITDNSETKGGKVNNNYNANARAYGVFLTAGTLKLENGTIRSVNPHKYSTAAANKSSAATAVYVTAGQTFTMDNGAIESASQYASYALYMARGTSTVKINNGFIKGETTASTTAAGIYNLGKGLTVNGGRIVGHAYTTTAYGIYLYGGHGTINGGTIEATNDTTSNKGTTTAYGIYVNYYNSTYKGALTIPSTSTVKVLAKARTTTAYAIVVGGGSTASKIQGGTFTAQTKTGKTAYSVNSSGDITISGGTFNANAATTNAYGLYSARGTITVSGNPTFNVTSGTSTAYGALAYGTIGKKGTGKYSGTIKINGGTFNVTSTSTDAYGALAGLASRDLRSCSATNDTVPGMHYMPGILEISSGTFNVKAKTTTAYGIHVAAAKSESGTVGTTTRIPKGTITGGKFKVESAGDANATAYAMNTATTAARLVVQGGSYSTKRTTAATNIEDLYTAPAKDCNYRVLILPEEQLPYKYKVAEAYNVSFKDGDENTIQSSWVEKDTTPVYAGETPTKTATDEYTYTFIDTWSPAIAPVTGDATYTAQFSSTKQKYTITWLVKISGVTITEKTEQVEYGQTPSYGDDPTYGPTESRVYTFSGWIPEVSTVKGNQTYNGSFNVAPRSYTITFVNDDNTTVLQSGEVNYGVDPSYTGATPVSTENAAFAFIGWTPALTAVTEEATYTATYQRIVAPIVVEADETITQNTTTTTTTVRVTGRLSIDPSATLTTDDLILEGTPSSSGEITGNGGVDVTQHAYYDLTKEGGFKAKTWYSVAVPWQVAVPAYDKAHNGVYMREEGGAFVQQELGRSYDLIYYDGVLRAATGHSDACWKYIEDDAKAEQIMYPGRAYMIYFLKDIETIRFERKEGAELQTITLAVEAHNSTDNRNAGWNGIANPSTYHAYINPNTLTDNTYGGVNYGQLYDGDNWSYQAINLDEHPLVVGQPVYVQVAASNPSVVAYADHDGAFHAPRRAKANMPIIHCEVGIAPSEGETKDRVVVRALEDKDDEYVIAQDLIKLDVSTRTPQIWVDRYDSRLCINTVAPTGKKADYPLGIRVPYNGSYTIDPLREIDANVSLYLTYNGRAIWNLGYGPYEVNLPQGTNNQYGLRVVYEAPQLVTGVDEATIENGEQIRKVVIEDKVYIIRNGATYSITGAKVQ